MLTNVMGILPAGTGNVISPATTSDALLPGFALLGLCTLVTGITFTLIGVEPHGKPLRLD